MQSGAVAAEFFFCGAELAIKLWVRNAFDGLQCCLPLFCLLFRAMMACETQSVNTPRPSWWARDCEPDLCPSFIHWFGGV